MALCSNQRSSSTSSGHTQLYLQLIPVHATADFGLARQMSERVRLAAQSLQDEHGSPSVSAVLTRFGGTPFYIAPEVSRLEAHR